MNGMLKISIRRNFTRALCGSTGIYLFGTAMGFLVGVQLARGLGVVNYGLYGSAMAAASLGATVAAGGLQLHATREIAASRARGEHEAAARLIVWSFRMLLGLGGTAALAVGGYVLWGQHASPMLALSAVVVTILMAVLWLVGGIVRGAGSLLLGQALDVAIRPAAHSALLLLALFALGEIDPDLALMLSSIAIIAALPVGWSALARVSRASGASRTTRTERIVWRRASAMMGLTTIIRAADAAVPLILIGVLSNLEEAGLFRVAAAMMLLPTLPATMITVLVPAMVSSLYEKREMESLRQLAKVSGLAMLIPTMALAGALCLYGGTLLYLAFGDDYRAAWATLSVLSCATAINALSGIGICLLHAGRHERTITQVFGVSLAATTMGVLLLANSSGAVGVAIAVFIGTAVRTAYLIVATLRLTQINPTFLSAFLK